MKVQIRNNVISEQFSILVSKMRIRWKSIIRFKYGISHNYDRRKIEI
jgi:hypothetical protein